MNTGNDIKIIAVINDAVLRGFIVAGMSGRAGLAVQSRTSLRDAADEAAKSGGATVLLFDSPPDAKDSWFRSALTENTFILPLLIADREGAKPPKGLPEQNVLTLPLRLGALLDRALRHGVMGPQRTAAFSLGPFLVAPGDSTLTDAKSGRVVKLTEKERDILLKLYDRRGQTVDRRELLDDIWGYAEGIETHTLETHIYRLRQKIEDDPAKPQWLLTEETGYRLAL